MSYILDALKRADAERGQSTTPSLPSESPFALPRPGRPSASARTWVWGAAVLVLLAMAAWAWKAWRPNADSTAQQSEPPIISAAADPKPVNAPRAESASATPAAAAPAADQAPEAARAPTAPVLPILAKKAPSPPAAPPKPRAAPEAAASTPSAPPKVSQAANPVPKLSAEQRAALPAIAVSGTSYSTNPAHRMLIANGQVVKEGQELSPGLTLESIGARSAIFNLRGTRFNVNY